MARPSQINRENLAPLIRARGPVSATELAAALRVNRTTIARSLPDFGDELVTLGATRSTRYLLRREIRNIGNRWPVYSIDANGRAGEWAELEALHEHLWRVNWAGDPPDWAGIFMEENGLWNGFPFFLSDARPQGFLGRAIASRISRALQLPDDPRSWNDEDVLVYHQTAGEDLPGNLVVGDDCLRRALARSADLASDRTIREEEREIFYPLRAVEVSQDLPGSSAGGEQPKFLATLCAEDGGFRPVLVKFTAPMEQENGRRWADLLVCEFHAHEVLAEAGFSNPGALLSDAGGRRFLETPRFDRRGASGRLGVVSLEALSAASVGLARDWSTAVGELARRGMIDSNSLATVQRLQAFGELIGNSDMHAGNLSFFLGESMPLRVTPSYDMLPMLWAPSTQGELVERRFAPSPPLPAMTDTWREAAVLAEDFWSRVAADQRLTPAFATMGSEALGVVRRLRSHVG
jgi:hypothetical protein